MSYSILDNLCVEDMVVKVTEPEVELTYVKVLLLFIIISWPGQVNEPVLYSATVFRILVHWIIWVTETKNIHERIISNKIYTCVQYEESSII